MRRHRRTAALHLADGLDQILRRRALEHVTVRAGGERLENIFRVLVNRQHHHLRLRQQSFQLSHALDAVHAGQIDIHQHNVWPHFRQISHGIFRVGVIGRKTKSVRAANYFGERAAQFVVVLDDGNGNRHWLKGGSKNAECRKILQQIIFNFAS